MSQSVIDLHARRKSARAQTKIDPTRFAIRTNNLTSEPCAICNAETATQGDVDLMLDDALVCAECGRRYAPLLQSLLDLSHAACRYSGQAMREVFPEQFVEK
jgi:transcription elongation factor Elf1